MWDQTTINLGTVTENSEHTISFHYDGDISLIRDNSGKNYKISTSCGCSSANWDSKTNTLLVTFKAKPVPIHLASIGEYTTSPTVTFPSIINQHQEVDQKLTIIVKVVSKIKSN